MVQLQDKIIHCYNQVAEDYAAERSDELLYKRFDRLLLKEFASANSGGPYADFGCGPGQATKFLYENGVESITGIDISPGMIEVARRLHPEIKFETGDLLDISYASNSFGNVLAFYAIVHFTRDQIRIAFNEINRVLKDNGQFLFSFHVGEETVHFDKAHDKVVDVDLYFYPTDQIIELLHDTGFRTIEVLERYPYPNEYGSRRGYIWTEKRSSHTN